MRKLIMAMCCLLLGVAILTGTARAEYMFAQGNVAEVENPADCTYKYFGWGLDIAQDAGLSNWVHMPVPSKSGGTWGARYIRLRFYTGSVDAFVSKIDVYNGSVKVKEFVGLSYSNGWKDIQLDLGSKMTFSRGMGISFKINAGVEMMSHRFVFSSAGANFYQ